MTLDRARLGLFAIFIVGLCIQLAVVAVSYTQEVISAGDLNALITKFLTVYSVHLAVSIAGLFAPAQRRTRTRVPQVSLVSAVMLSTLWNVLLLWRTTMFGIATFDVSRTDSVASLSGYVDTVASTGSFLVVGALAYFFGQDCERQSRR